MIGLGMENPWFWRQYARINGKVRRPKALKWAAVSSACLGYQFWQDIHLRRQMSKNHFISKPYVYMFRIDRIIKKKIIKVKVYNGPEWHNLISKFW